VSTKKGMPVWVWVAVGLGVLLVGEEAIRRTAKRKRQRGTGVPEPVTA
jgi:hypothetical protein